MIGSICGLSICADVNAYARPLIFFFLNYRSGDSSSDGGWSTPDENTNTTNGGTTTGDDYGYGNYSYSKSNLTFQSATTAGELRVVVFFFVCLFCFLFFYFFFI